MEKSKSCGRKGEWEALTMVYRERMMSWTGEVPVEMEKRPVGSEDQRIREEGGDREVKNDSQVFSLSNWLMGGTTH